MVFALMPSPCVTTGEPGHDGRGDQVKRCHELGRALANGLAWHAGNDAS